VQKQVHNPVLVLGATRCAAYIARDLSAVGRDVVVAAAEPLSDLQPFVETIGSDRILGDARVLDLDGAPGTFSVRMSVHGEHVTLQPTAIVVAERDVRIPNFGEYDLSPAPCVFSLSDLCASLDGDGPDPFEQVRHLVFLNGLNTESHPVISEEIMRRSILLQNEHDVQTYILTRNLKVAADGLEALYRESKAAGTIYVKFGDIGPEIRQGRDGSVSMEFDDDITGMPLTLAPDAVVVDETIRPSDVAIDIGRRLGIETDSNRFLQGDNVHRLAVQTNRKGIFVAGPARSIGSGRDHRMDAGNAAIAANEIQGGACETDDRAVIDRWQCVRCLTCFRICPHGAIHVEGRVTVMPDACERCGICTAECPRHAIRITGLDAVELSRHVTMDRSSDARQQDVAPTIVAFCCTRSGTAAADLARCMGCALPERLTVVEVPCAGILSYDHFFAAFQRGADGVLAITCHRDNCHSSRGNEYAKHRMEQLSEVFRQTGFSTERLKRCALASNMGREFADILTGFETTLRGLGPSPIKPWHHLR